MEISRLDVERELRSRFALYKPYPKQIEFHNSLASCRLISGANQSGKTIAGTHECAFQATGIYPEWYKGWKGKSRIDVVSGKPVFNVVVAATDSKTLRDSIMKKLVGSEQDDFSDGLIAKK